MHSYIHTHIFVVVKNNFWIFAIQGAQEIRSFAKQIRKSGIQICTYTTIHTFYKYIHTYIHIIGEEGQALR